MRPFRIVLLAPFAATAARPDLAARIDLLLLPPAAAVAGVTGLELVVHLNNPTDRPETAQLPAQVEADYATELGPDRAVFAVVGGARTLVIPAMRRAEVRLRLLHALRATGGFVSLRLTAPPTNAIMFELSGPSPAPAAEPALLQAARHVDLTSDHENMRRHISAYDPIYFAIGSRDRLNARFQFSFKYRVLEQALGEESWWRHAVRDLYFAYTQTSIWDLESFSKPFYDTSYKPTVFFLHELPRAPRSPWQLSLQSGAQHESNGKSGAPVTSSTRSGLLSPTLASRHPSDTRSLNTLYLVPQVRWTDDSGFFLSARARISAFYQIDENPDITDYRGHVELTLRGGYDRGPQVSVHLRGKPGAHGSVEFNFTWPANQTPLLKNLEFLRSLGGYAQIQYFNGYGESLLDYDVRRRDQLRFGLMIVR